MLRNLLETVNLIAFFKENFFFCAVLLVNSDFIIVKYDGTLFS